MKPKYHIGQEAFYIDSREVLKRKITGIVILFKEKQSWHETLRNGKEPTFDHYEYNFEIENRPYNLQYAWIPEDRIFATKEELLASL